MKEKNIRKRCGERDKEKTKRKEDKWRETIGDIWRRLRWIKGDWGIKGMKARTEGNERTISYTMQRDKTGGCRINKMQMREWKGLEPKNNSNADK